jgi:hypothetical protein
MGTALLGGYDATSDVTAAADAAIPKYATISDATISADHAKQMHAMEHHAKKS